MPNINLKYLIIAVVSLSILIIMGTFIFSLIKPFSKPASNSTGKSQQPSSSPKQSQATQSAIPAYQLKIGPGGGTIPSEGAQPSSQPIPKSPK